MLPLFVYHKKTTLHIVFGQTQGKNFPELRWNEPIFHYPLLENSLMEETHDYLH
jgi:hypothetical protein